MEAETFDIGDIVMIKAKGYGEAWGEIIDLPDQDPRYSVAIDGQAGHRFLEKDLHLLQKGTDEEGFVYIEPTSHDNTCSYCLNPAVEHIVMRDLRHQVHTFYTCGNHERVWRYPDGSC